MCTIRSLYPSLPPVTQPQRLPDTGPRPSIYLFCLSATGDSGSRAPPHLAVSYAIPSSSALLSSLGRPISLRLKHADSSYIRARPPWDATTRRCQLIGHAKRILSGISDEARKIWCAQSSSCKQNNKTSAAKQNLHTTPGSTAIDH